MTLRIFEANRTATLQDVSWLRKAMGRELRALRLPAESLDDLQLAFSELATNAIVHGSPAPSFLDLAVDIDGALLMITLSDDGGCFNGFHAACASAKKNAISPEATSGRGLHIVQRAFDSMDYRPTEHGNVFVGRKSLRFSRAKILVVEDVQCLLTTYCEHLGHDFHPIGCTSLAEARSVIQTQRIDAVLTDFHLADGSGTSLLAEYDKLWPEASPPVILVSADKSPQIKDAALRFGAEFFVEKPVKREQLISTIRLALDRSMIRNARLTRSFGRHVDALVALAPPEQIGAYGLGVAAATAASGGGDILLHHRHEDFERLVIVDVMGHGVPAKAWAVAYAAIIKTLQQERALDAAGFLRKLSEIAWNDRSLESALATVMVLDINDFGATIASAGHPPPLVFGTETIRIPVGGPLLGVMPPCDYASTTIALNPGDRLVFFTDGIDPMDVAAGGAPPHWFLQAFETSRSLTLDRTLASVKRAAERALGPQPADDWLVAVLEKAAPR